LVSTASLSHIVNRATTYWPQKRRPDSDRRPLSDISHQGSYLSGARTGRKVRRTMSADFWAGYISGAVGIIIGNPLDLIKVRLQAGFSSSSSSSSSSSPTTTQARHFESTSALIRGTAAPVLGYGALNALLFVSYNRSEAFLNDALGISGQGGEEEAQRRKSLNLWTTFAAGMVGGLATWVVSTPTELVKCRAQLAREGSEASSWRIARDVLRREGLRGLYRGGVVTALRDSVGYGFYFWSYELGMRLWGSAAAAAAATTAGGDSRESVEGAVGGGPSGMQDAVRVLLCGGVAGIVTWASIFPLDVIKTRVQAQGPSASPAGAGAGGGGSGGGGEMEGLLTGGRRGRRRKGAVAVAREAYREGGVRVFFRGLTVCSVRAFVVNAVQWAVYEYVMRELGQGRSQREEPAKV
jgi:solute carrier family 25 (mitochondrial carnitine/acylcarnitine transporter), member 20/29